MEKLPVIADVEGLGKIVEAYTDFYSELQQLKADNARLISPRDEAYVRIHTKGKENIGKNNGTRTRAGFEHIKKQLPILRLNSRLTNLKLAKLAVEANRAGNYFCTNSTKEYEDSLKQAKLDENEEPIKRNVIVLPSRGNFTISDKENWETYQAILKEQAKPYFELNGPITVYPVDKNTVDSQNGTLLTHLWFGYLGDWSGFLGYCRYLDGDLRARGVCRSAEGTQKNLLYTPKEINKYQELIQGVRTGDLPASKLEKVAEFFEKLKKQ